MSYYDRGGYNNYNHHHHRGGFRYNQPRINENQVPQSKHTIFIRGLGGDVTTEEIKEYIGERVGNISFDFVKHTQDRSKMFVAVRFEKREEAKEFMESYAEREFMGYRCELSWFRDIRRYCAYQRTKQVRSNSQRRRRRSDSEESRHSSRRSTPARRSRSGSRENARESRSPSRTSRSPSRSRSRSPRSRSRGSDRDRSRSRSNDRRSRSNERRSRSVSRGSRDDSRRSNRDESRNGHNDSMDRRSDDETERDRSRKRDSERRESRSKRRREPSESDDDVIVEEKPRRKAKEDLPQIPLPPKAPTPVKPKTHSYIPPPSVDMEIESPKGAYEPSPPQHVNPYQANQRSFQKEPSPANVHVTSYAVPMEEEAAPRLIIREPQPPAPTPAVAAYAASTYPSAQAQNPYAQHMNVQQQQVLAPQQYVAAAPPVPVAVQQSPAPAQPAPPAPAPTTPTSAAQQPAFVPRQVSKIEILMPASLPMPTPAPAPVPAPMPSVSASNTTLNGASQFNLDPVLFPKSHKLFGHLKAFQTALLSTVKFEPPVNKDEEEELSTLRLSSFGQEEDTEESKALDREDKLARLSDEQMMRFHIKKKQFEAAFRNDCETYSVVTRALLNKDESLLFGLRMSLFENMEDLHKKMMQRVDDLLDQLLKMS